jgi:hypothetical protein
VSWWLEESFFKRSHKVIVALAVQEILEEHIAKKLVKRTKLKRPAHARCLTR